MCPNCGVYRGPHQNDCSSGGVLARLQHAVDAAREEKRKEQRIINAVQGRRRNDNVLP
jgi:hypothetical protein